MIVHDLEQRCLDWFKLHIGIPTASEFDSFIDTSMKLRDGEMPKTYVARKAAEAYMRRPIISGTANVRAMEQGNIMEEEARPFAAVEFDLDIRCVGFCTTDDKRAGCSPDGLIGDDCGIEIKCPTLDVHTKYLLNGGLPKDYAVQVHFSMYVTGYPSWFFLSYHRGMPPLLKRIPRDEEKIAKIHEGVTAFHARLNEALAKLNALRFGPARELPKLEEVA